MKYFKVFLASFLVFFLSNAATAQGFGIRAGVNFATVTGGDIPNVGGVTGYYGGVYYQMPIIKDLLYFQPELQYSAQGFSSSVSGTSVDYTMDYITVPTLVRLYVLEIFSFEAGPQFGFNVSDSFSTTDFNGESVETFDPALALGFNINLPFRLSLDARYVYSFSEVVPNTSEKNQLVQAGVSFRF